MKLDSESVFLIGLFSTLIVISICVTCYAIHFSEVTVEYAKAGLEECVRQGDRGTVWQRGCK